jgi:hypothetical protein
LGLKPKETNKMKIPFKKLTFAALLGVGMAGFAWDPAVISNESPETWVVYWPTLEVGLRGALVKPSGESVRLHRSHGQLFSQNVEPGETLILELVGAGNHPRQEFDLFEGDGEHRYVLTLAGDTEEEATVSWDYEDSLTYQLTEATGTLHLSPTDAAVLTIRARVAAGADTVPETLPGPGVSTVPESQGSPGVATVPETMGAGQAEAGGL